MLANLHFVGPIEQTILSHSAVNKSVEYIRLSHKSPVHPKLQTHTNGLWSILQCPNKQSGHLFARGQPRPMSRSSIGLERS